MLAHPWYLMYREYQDIYYLVQLSFIDSILVAWISFLSDFRKNQSTRNLPDMSGEKFQMSGEGVNVQQRVSFFVVLFMSGEIPKCPARGTHGLPDKMSSEAQKHLTNLLTSLGPSRRGGAFLNLYILGFQHIWKYHYVGTVC